MKVVIETPLVDFAVATNLVGDETVVEDGEETVICAKPGRQKVEIRKASVKDLKVHTPGEGYVAA